MCRYTLATLGVTVGSAAIVAVPIRHEWITPFISVW